MKIKTTIKQEVEIDIEPEEAFRILCKSLKMEFVLNDYFPYDVKKNQFGENVVLHKMKNLDPDRDAIDDRGDLFVALRNVAVQLFPNIGFRSDEYIMIYGE